MNLAAVDLNLLVAFEALVEERHVTRAADRVGLTQPAMSNALKRLRALFADDLFVRAGPGMRATDKALALAQPIGQALQQIRSALAPEMPFVPAEAHRRIAIGTTDYGSIVVVPEIARLLRRKAPSIDLLVRPITNAREAVAELEQGQVDALIGGHLPGSSYCIRQKLFDESFVCIRDAQHGNDHAAISLDEFAASPHALFSSSGGDGLPSIVDALLARHGRQRRIAHTVSHVMAVPFAVSGTDLVAMVAERIARRFSTQADLSALAPPFEVPSFAVDLVYANRSIRDPALKWFFEGVSRIYDNS